MLTQTDLIRGIGEPAYQLATPAECGCPVKTLRRITQHIAANRDALQAALGSSFPRLLTSVEVLCDAVCCNHHAAVNEALKILDLVTEFCMKGGCK